MIEFLEDIFRRQKDQTAIIWKSKTLSYDWLLGQIENWTSEFRKQGIRQGQVVAVSGEFSPVSIALFLSLTKFGCILVPLSSSLLDARKKDFIEIAKADWILNLDQEDQVSIRSTNNFSSHPLYESLRKTSHPGLVLFSSGSTGTPKAAVHDLVSIMEKFKAPRNRWVTLGFLLFDHIGGINTLFYTLFNAGCFVTVPERSPEHVLEAIEKYAVQLLPTTPTFLNLVLMTGIHERFNIKSLRLVTYGTEPMPETTLKKFHAVFPDIELVQTYGLSEVGILRAKSESSDSLWVKVGGEGFKTRIVDGILHIKAKSAMLGYLNSPSPFLEDGWFDTGDLVEQRGDFLRFLGRKSEIINVGGQKVYPVEVEDVIKKIPEVVDVTVFGEKNALLGQIVSARISVVSGQDPKESVKRIKKFCREQMDEYKVPVKINIIESVEVSSRFKKVRNLN